LWAFLSGNAKAQERFSDYYGPTFVAKALSRASADYAKDSSNAKLVDRLVKIATDMANADPWKIPELCMAMGSVPLLPDRATYLQGVKAYTAACPQWREHGSNVKLQIGTLLESLAEDDEDVVVATTILQTLSADDN
jgi:hypothetical protein